MKHSIQTVADRQGMRTAGKLAASVLDMISCYLRAGISTGKINDICHQYIVDEIQAKPAPLGYRGFPKSICTSVNQQVCHGIPNNAKVLRNGDIVNVDITIIKDGYHGDTSKMFCIGKVPDRVWELVNTTKACLYQAIELVKPGTRLGDLGSAIQNIAHDHGFSVVRDYCGHGIGKMFHEPPDVVHFGKAGEGVQLVQGQTFTVEPMINLGKKDTRVLSDGWTVVTRDRSMSAQWEHTLLVTADGVEVLTLRDEEQDLQKRLRAISKQ